MRRGDKPLYGPILGLRWPRQGRGLGGYGNFFTTWGLNDVGQLPNGGR